MNIVSKILVGLIFVASLGFIYLAAATLQTEGNWQKKVATYERQIEEKVAENKRRFCEFFSHAEPVRLVHAAMRPNPPQ